MSDPILGLAMLGLIIVVIMLGFPTAFTLMGLGMMFGFVAFYDPSQSWTANKVFNLMVQRTFGGMTNDVLLSIPLFVLMEFPWRVFLTLRIIFLFLSNMFPPFYYLFNSSYVEIISIE